MLSSRLTDNQESACNFALVTGAAQRLGKVFALRLAQLGFGIFLHYHNSSDKVESVVEEIRGIGVPVFPIQADLRNETEIRDLFSRIDNILGKPEDRLKVLVNSAAVMTRGNAMTISMSEFDATISLNLRAPFFCAQFAYQRMSSRSLIVNISDVAAQKAWTGYPAYTVSKAGLDSLTKVLAHSFAPKVRVNAIAPGLAIPPDDYPPAEWERLVRRLPSQRAASPDELGNALEFLIKNEYITGQTIVVDGGYALI
jgi:pteridine reductase